MASTKMRLGVAGAAGRMGRRDADVALARMVYDVVRQAGAAR